MSDSDSKLPDGFRFREALPSLGKDFEIKDNRYFYTLAVPVVHNGLEYERVDLEGNLPVRVLKEFSIDSLNTISIQMGLTILSRVSNLSKEVLDCLAVEDVITMIGSYLVFFLRTANERSSMNTSHSK